MPRKRDRAESAYETAIAWLARLERELGMKLVRALTSRDPRTALSALFTAENQVEAGKASALRSIAWQEDLP